MRISWKTSAIWAVGTASGVASVEGRRKEKRRRSGRGVNELMDVIAQRAHMYTARRANFFFVSKTKSVYFQTHASQVQGTCM